MANDTNSIMDTLQSLLANIPQDKINSVIGALSDTDSSLDASSGKESPSLTNTPAAQSSIQADSIMKITSLYQKLTDRSNPRASLLLSLKPYLKKNKHSSIDMAINLLNLGSVLPVSNLIKPNINKSNGQQ